MIAWQQPFEQHHDVVYDASVIDLSGGYDAYVGRRRAEGSHVFAKTDGQARRLEKDLGPIVFEAESLDTAALEQLIEWKSDQYRRSDLLDQFAVPWSVELLKRTLADRGPEFAGTLSVLRAGGSLAAAAFGLRSRSCWHYWYPAYSRTLSAYSPGMILLLRMIEDQAGRGIREVDLGRGEEAYKYRLRTGVVGIAEGRVVVSPSLAGAVWLGTTARRLTRETSLARPLRHVRWQLQQRFGSSRA